MDIIYKGYTYSTQWDQRLQYDVIRVLMAVSFLGALLSLSFKFLNKTSKFQTFLSQNSYHIYLVHYPILVLLQFLFVRFNIIDSLVKFTVIVIVSVFSSAIIGEFLIRRKVSIYYAGLTALFVILIFTI